MTADHFNQLLKERLLRDPFQVFAIEMRGGRQIEIDRPFATVLRDGVAIHLGPGGIPVEIDYDQVNRIIDTTARVAS